MTIAGAALTGVVHTARRLTQSSIRDRKYHIHCDHMIICPPIEDPMEIAAGQGRSVGAVRRIGRFGHIQDNGNNRFAHIGYGFGAGTGVTTQTVGFQ